MKNQFKFFLITLFALTLIACGRMGDLTLNEETKIDSEESTSSTY